MIILNFFTNILFYYFTDELALFHTMMSWACPRRVVVVVVAGQTIWPISSN